MARMATYDSGNQYAVDYMWFTTGIAYNAQKAKERLGDVPRAKDRDAPRNTWPAAVFGRRHGEASGCAQPAQRRRTRIL